jgi:PadR family transcriptional regulator, regulatory protein PadR
MSRDYLTDFELMVLLSVLRLGDDAYGVPVAREIEALGERTVMLATVYAALDRLEANGQVSSAMGEPTPERGGRAKKYFRVTPTGLRSVRRAQRAFTRLWTGIPQLQLKGDTA